MHNTSSSHPSTEDRPRPVSVIHPERVYTPVPSHLQPGRLRSPGIFGVVLSVMVFGVAMVIGTIVLWSWRQPPENPSAGMGVVAICAWDNVPHAKHVPTCGTPRPR